jgi:hypothetical protein
MHTILSALQHNARIDCSAAPLSRVVGLLGDQHDIEIELDGPALAALGVKPDVPCTLQIRDVSLADALDRLLANLGLTYVIQDGGLLITAPKKAAPAEDQGKAKALADPGPRR